MPGKSKKGRNVNVNKAGNIILKNSSSSVIDRSNPPELRVSDADQPITGWL